MDYEAQTLRLLELLLPHIDPTKNGWCIEAGVGSHTWYFGVFYGLGYRAVCIEPMPTEDLITYCFKHSIHLFPYALADIHAELPYYTGRDGNNDLGGIEPNAWGAADGIAVQVKCWTLTDVINAIRAERVTCLKMDIEGAEHRVLAQLPTMDNRPASVCFEYGGGEFKRNGVFAWNTEGRAHFVKGLTGLQQAGYNRTVFMDATQATTECYLQHETIDTALLDRLFSGDASCGNAIAVQGQYDELLQW